MTHQKQRTGKKEDQSHSTVICSVHMVSIRVYIELLKSYSHLIMQLGVALISSDTFLRLQTCRVESQSISSMKRGPQRTAILGISVIEIRGSQTCFSITKPDPVKQVYCPPEWCLSPLRLALSICRVQRNTRSNSICYYIFIIVILCQITFLQFFKSRPWWLIQFQLIIALRILQIALFHNSSSEKRRRIGGCQHENVRSYVSVNVVLCKKTF